MFRIPSAVPDMRSYHYIVKNTDINEPSAAAVCATQSPLYGKRYTVSGIRYIRCVPSGASYGTLRIHGLFGAVPRLRKKVNSPLDFASYIQHKQNALILKL